MRGSKLDLYLSKGYFRMQQDVFTCFAVLFENAVCPVHWLRIDLANVIFGKEQTRLFRINEKFSVDVKPLVITPEIEVLYTTYKAGINFDAPETVESCLLDGATFTMFDTYAVEVRDNNTLIAVGVFDSGAQSIAGIMNFYDPAYRKHSLGKYLMLQKISYARQQHKTYYYPGYLASNYDKFNYKLFACETATEVFDANRDRWYPFSWQTVNVLAAEIMNGH
ncbi:arginine-tRNA-protein transferase [Spirosoma pollinicola]|uniref:Arginine-tRNA-protein transferase n=1 Tax=Spirosoma pollinicola TaxID=2057025 RepID=A0A2K8YZA3_9BACT|nr:arginine-tRNA-protein transferase [Spirosoma pollinicola]AUD02904.1 arginine-tRNA-protein transferase [Spirosoma pollinicola]